ncbi:hypothetical protein H072_6798 [Dactylellina haptotyla CBS 200.50]|uniref:Uncharacterized protein n=1 Tax=Dactylellina haptotyla (strain CBS 200.50) TaxID=1284197 RepID=S8A8T9_DACHA|nr:hypothetical protein H072_6798 [Dactylellina haptotyla CBS 200.50]
MSQITRPPSSLNWRQGNNTQASSSASSSNSAPRTPEETSRMQQRARQMMPPPPLPKRVQPPTTIPASSSLNNSTEQTTVTFLIAGQEFTVESVLPPYNIWESEYAQDLYHPNYTSLSTFYKPDKQFAHLTEVEQRFARGMHAVFTKIRIEIVSCREHMRIINDDVPIIERLLFGDSLIKGRLDPDLCKAGAQLVKYVQSRPTKKVAGNISRGGAFTYKGQRAKMQAFLRTSYRYLERFIAVWKAMSRVAAAIINANTIRKEILATLQKARNFLQIRRIKLDYMQVMNEAEYTWIEEKFQDMCKVLNMTLSNFRREYTPIACDFARNYITKFVKEMNHTFDAFFWMPYKLKGATRLTGESMDDVFEMNINAVYSTIRALAAAIKATRIASKQMTKRSVGAGVTRSPRKKPSPGPKKNKIPVTSNFESRGRTLQRAPESPKSMEV